MLTYIKFFYNLYKKRNSHQSFLDRKDADGNRYKVMKRTLSKNILVEKKSEGQTSKRDYAVYMLVEALEENDRLKLKTELFEIISILTVWYLSIKENDEQHNSD